MIELLILKLPTKPLDMDIALLNFDSIGFFYLSAEEAVLAEGTKLFKGSSFSNKSIFLLESCKYEPMNCNSRLIKASVQRLGNRILV